MKVNWSPLQRFVEQTRRFAASARDVALPILASGWSRAKRLAARAAEINTRLLLDIRRLSTRAAARIRLVVETTRARANALADRIWVRIGPTVLRIDARIRRTTPTTAGVIASSATLAAIVIALGVYQLKLNADARAARTFEAHFAVPVARTPGVSQPGPQEPQAGVAPPRAALPQVGEAFIDRFDGNALNGRWFVGDGWSNGDHMENIWRKEQVSVGAEGLKLTMERAKPGAEKPLVSAEIQTRETFRYGYFEIRMRVPKGAGTVTGFFTYAGPDKKSPSNEIDVEIVGKDTTRVDLTSHAGGNSGVARPAVPGDAARDFHVYGFDWQPTYVRWYVDGKLVHEVTGANARKLVKPQKIMIDLWASKQLKSWVGDLDMNGGPWVLTASCVAYAPTYDGRSLCLSGND